jgi:orotate phosphoribosyltransferase
MDRKNLNKIALLQYLMDGFLPTPEDVLEWFKILEAGWIHDGDPAKPHAKLHSGKCSNGFFLCKKVLAYGNLREILAYCIIRNLRNAGLEEKKVGGVFGSPYSSILLAGDVARLLGVKVYVPEKDPNNPKGMIFKPDDVIPEGTQLLGIEELITTFDSAAATAQAITVGNPYPVTFLPFVGVLVFRPSMINRLSPDGRQIVSVIEKQVDAWDPADCPFCKQGSKPLPPKTNWAELTS